MFGASSPPQAHFVFRFCKKSKIWRPPLKNVVPWKKKSILPKKVRETCHFQLKYFFIFSQFKLRSKFLSRSKFRSSWKFKSKFFKIFGPPKIRVFQNLTYNVGEFLKPPGIQQFEKLGFGLRVRSRFRCRQRFRTKLQLPKN